MKRLDIVLLHGTTASGKTFTTERLLAVDYDVSTAKMDSIYRQLLERLEFPKQNGRPHSIYKTARALREGAFDAELTGRFFETLDDVLARRIREASAWGVAMVFEGYTLKFPDEAERIVRVAREAAPKRRVVVSRVHVTPTLEDWNRNRAAKGQTLSSDAFGAANPGYHERKMAPPEPVPAVRDYAVRDLEEMRALAEEVIGLRRHKWYQRATLGPVETGGPSDAAEKVAAVRDDDVVGKKVVDVCCATGVHAVMLKQRGARSVVGVEMNGVRFTKARELKKVLLRHSDVDARVDFRLGDAREVLPKLPRFDTAVCFGCIHYFEDYEGFLGMLAAAVTGAVYVEFTFAEGEHDSAENPGVIAPYTRTKSGTTIYMGDRDAVAAAVAAGMPDFEIAERTKISPPGRASDREIWRLRRG
jgi:SAM-dependent methyltransferase